MKKYLLRLLFRHPAKIALGALLFCFTGLIICYYILFSTLFHVGENFSKTDSGKQLLDNPIVKDIVSSFENEITPTEKPLEVNK
jgi:hypothetical protein